MTVKTEPVRGGAEDVLEALRGVAVCMDGARELQHESDRGRIGRVGLALVTLVARGGQLAAQTTLGVGAEGDVIACWDSRPRGRA